MARSWFVRPETVRLPLSEEQWIEVKKRLTVGEERAAFQQSVGDTQTRDGGWKPNFEMIGLVTVAAYIVRWSLVDDDGAPVPVSVQAIQALDVAHYTEIDAAIDVHIKRVEAALAAEKNGTGGEIEPATTSPSVA